MAAGSTYTPIATTTLGSATNTVTFSSITASYTDLYLIVVGAASSSTTGVNLQFNADTGSNYSRTVLYGTGSVAGSARGSNAIQIGTGTFSTSQSVARINIMNYSNSTTYKTILARTDAASVELLATVGLWRSTSAINEVKVISDSGINFITGSTFTLYGIAAA